MDQEMFDRMWTRQRSWRIFRSFLASKVRKLLHGLVVAMDIAGVEEAGMTSLR